MSEILSNIVVESINTTFTPNVNQITIVPNVGTITITTAGIGGPQNAGPNALLYNNNNQFGAVPNANVVAGNLTFSNLSNLKINGGNYNYYLRTDGTGNLAWAAGTANLTGNGTSAGIDGSIQLGDGFGNFKAITNLLYTTSFVQFPAGVVTGGYLQVNSGGIEVLAGNISANAGTMNSNYARVQNDANVFGNVYIQGNLTVIGTTNIVANTANTANYANYAGNVTISAQPNITSLGTLTQLNVTGTTSIQQALEKVTANSTGSTGTVVYDLLTQAIIQKTANAVSNFNLNFRGNSTVTMNSFMSTNTSATCTYINKNGTTARYLQNVQIDGATRTVNWLSGTVPGSLTATANGYDVYQFNFIKTAANTYTIYGTFSGYK